MLGKASVVKTRNQVKDIPVHQERVFSFVAILLFYNTKVRIKSDKQKNVAKLLADRRFRKMAWKNERQKRQWKSQYEDTLWNYKGYINLQYLIKDYPEKYMPLDFEAIKNSKARFVIVTSMYYRWIWVFWRTDK